MQDNQKLKCSRCGHETHQKSNLLTHLRRKKPCLDKLHCNLSCKDLIKQLLVPKNIEKYCTCPHCDKFIDKLSFEKHELICKYQVEKDQTMCNDLREKIHRSINVIIALEEKDYHIRQLEEKITKLDKLVDALMDRHQQIFHKTSNDNIVGSL